MAKRSWLTGVFAVLAFAQTMAYYVYLRDDAGNYNGAGAQGDQVAYIDLAQQVLHGTWQGAVHYMPGLPAVIALGQLSTGDPRLGIALIQGLVYAACVVFAARLAAASFGERAQTWAAALVGLNPALGYYAAQALTEFLTAAVLLALLSAVFLWGLQPRLLTIALIGLLIGAAAYLRSEYLGLSVVYGVIVLWILRRRRAQAILSAALIIGVTVLTMAPWVVRYALITGSPALYNESPFSNLVLMGTWFRVFDEQTFSELQQIETAPGTRDQAIERARSVGPRPDLSQRYMEQSRGPYERPLPETLGLAADNIRLNLRQYLVNHVVLAPVLIWAGHTPLRQSDAPRFPSTARYTIWAAELALLALALWQAILTIRVATHSQRNSMSYENSSSSAEAENQGTLAVTLGFLGIFLFLTALHIVIAVDERFTIPALPLIGVFAGARAAQLVGRRQSVAVRYAA